MTNATKTNNTETENMATTKAQAATACNDNAALTGELLTLAEVATILKVSRKTLYAWKAQGKIRFVKIAGSLIRIPRGDLTALITRTGDGKAAPLAL